ncbi:OsmC family protein [Parapedobacter deserti]|uniref:OsmC family protein n=1 Tax=Parapedobacter deserti TaxID=1912957 RepID=A0ABV7JMJ9_9SPHI
MKLTRKATAHWKGTGKDGSGTVSTQSTVLDKTQYSYKTRFEDGVGTNPEELIGAAHAGCFTMQLSFLLSEKGYEPDSLDTEAKVTLEDGNITLIELVLRGEVADISESEFKEIAEKAKDICPVSKLLETSIELTATLA